MDAEHAPHRFPSPAIESAQMGRLARALLGADAEDGVQEAWVRALERREGARIDGGWLRGAVRNVARETRRAGRRRRSREGAAARAGTATHDPRTVERLAAHELLTTALGRLEEPYRTTLVWRYLDGRSAAEIARLLAAPPATVRWRLQEGRRRLRAILDETAQARGRSAPAALASLAASTGTGPLGTVGGWLMAQSLFKSGWGLALLVLLLAMGGVAWWATDSATSDALPPSEELAEGLEASPQVDPGLRGQEAPRVEGPAPVVEEAPEEIDDPFRVTGRVVDEQRRPVAGAAVVLHLATQQWPAVRTQEDGRYHLRCSSAALGPYALATLVARTDDGRMGTACMRLDTHVVDHAPVEPIVLSKSQPLEVRVVADGKPVADAEVQLEHRFHFIAYEARALVATGQTNGSGVWRAAEGFVGAYNIYVSHPVKGRARRYVRMDPERSGPVVVTLHPTRSVAVRVLDSESLEPLEGVQVELAATDSDRPRPLRPPVAPVMTDREGRATFEGVPRGEAHAFVKLPGYIGPITDYKTGRLRSLTASEPSLTLYMRPAESLMLPITRGDAGVPPDGTVLTVRTMYGEQGVEAVIEGDHVRVDNAPLSRIGTGDADLVASLEAPDGRIANAVWMGGRLVEELIFEAPRSLSLRVRHPDGRPADGLPLRVALRHTGMPPVVTDARGEAVVRGLRADTVHISRQAPEPFVIGMGDSVLLATFDASKDTQPLEITLPERTTVRLQIRIDGVPGLPTRYRLLHGSTLVHWREIEEDPATGVLTVRRTLAEGRRRFRVLAEGLLGDTVEVPEGEPSEEPLPVDLRTAGQLEVTVVPPEGGRFRLHLERWDPATQRWKRARREPDMHANAVDGTRWLEDTRIRFTRIASGRYRVGDHISRMTSPPVDVEAGGTLAETTLDLGRIVRVRGRVIVPKGEHAYPVQIHVRVDGKDRSPNWNVDGPKPPSGRFSFAAPVGSEVVVRLEHKRLHPREPEGLQVRVQRGMKELSLHLDSGGSRIRFRARSGIDGKPLPERIRCAVFAEGATEGASMHEAVLLEGRYVLDLVPQATPVEIILDPGSPFAPHRLAPRAYGSGDHDLSALRFDAGARLRVALVMAAGRERPMTRLVVRQRIGAYAFERRAWTSRGESEDLRASGLVGGNAEVRVGPGRLPAGAFTVGGPAPKAPPEIVESVELTSGRERELRVVVPDEG